MNCISLDLKTIDMRFFKRRLRCFRGTLLHIGKILFVFKEIQSCNLVFSCQTNELMNEFYFIKVLCVHLGMTSDFIWDYKKPEERLATPQEYKRILDDIHHEFVKDNKKIQYKHEASWKFGFFHS